MIDISVQVLRIGGPTWYPKIRVIWSVDYENEMTFKIYRGVTQGTVALVATMTGTAGVKSYTFDDTRDPAIPDVENIKLGNRLRNYFYRIDAYLPSGSLRESSETVSWGNSMYSAHELEIMRGHEYYFTKVSGTPFFMFKRKLLSKETCPVHWNKSLGRATNIKIGEVCKQCLNTGILNPYHDPVVVWLRIKNPENTDQQSDKLMKRHKFEMLKCDTNGLPRISVGDILLDNIDRVFYHVDEVSRVGKRHSEVKQNVIARAMAKEKPEYKWLEIATSDNANLITELIRQKKERKF